MSNVCPEHNVAWVWKEGGVSMKTGQPVPYSGFHKCPVYGCKNKPPRGWMPNGGAQQAPRQTQGPGAPARTPTAPVDWDKIAAGKCRSTVLDAWIMSRRPLEGFWQMEADLVRYKMTGQHPGFDEQSLAERWESVPPADDDVPSFR